MTSFENGQYGEGHLGAPETGVGDHAIHDAAVNGHNESAILLHLERPEIKRALENFARSLVRTTPGIEVADLLQDTMERAVRNASAYDPTREPLPWLETILYNRWSDLADRRKRDQRYVTGLPDEIPPSMEPVNHLTPEMIAATNEQIQVVQKILANLPHEQRQVFTMNVIDGKSPAEIAEALNLPLGTVKSRIRLAREKIDRLKNERLN